MHSPEKNLTFLHQEKTVITLVIKDKMENRGGRGDGCRGERGKEQGQGCGGGQDKERGCKGGPGQGQEQGQGPKQGQGCGKGRGQEMKAEHARGPE
ncbi:glycine-rich cell wall structural protein 1.8-like isoform X2 [Sphaeramia orbicularis]|uniref:glycine-rich cell wall structural protein 1.8-like isoform X2 n=1 Tax=Sphaeramia orbicularis TaxID=375764 RepID=UPI00117C4CE8|nr:glycine-rich cell wall structural protein 1.8-like isoform X2 [Sphaeramia orbicularis]